MLLESIHETNIDNAGLNCFACFLQFRGNGRAEKGEVESRERADICGSGTARRGMPSNSCGISQRPANAGNLLGNTQLYGGEFPGNDCDHRQADCRDRTHREVDHRADPKKEPDQQLRRPGQKCGCQTAMETLVASGSFPVDAADIFPIQVGPNLFARNGAGGSKLDPLAVFYSGALYSGRPLTHGWVGDTDRPCESGSIATFQRDVFLDVHATILPGRAIRCKPNIARTVSSRAGN